MIPEKPFSPADFRQVNLQERDLFEPMLIHSRERSCEFSFSNLYVWSPVYQNQWQIWNNRVYLYGSREDRLMFTSDAERKDDPSAEELHAVSEAMRSTGSSGIFTQVRKEYIDEHPELEKFFEIKQLDPSFAEYIYSVQELAELKGKKLSKKRNLIAQFCHAQPDCEVRPITSANIQDCIELSRLWRSMQDDPDSETIVFEAKATAHLADHYDDLHMEGVGAYFQGRLIAYALVNRIQETIWTEPFEKALPGCKGAAQFINHELAKYLYPRVQFLNREQDLGDAGLRHAKMSYAPTELLCNYELTLRDKTI